MHTFVFSSAQLTELHFQNVKDKYPSNGSTKMMITIVTVWSLLISYFYLSPSPPTPLHFGTCFFCNSVSTKRSK